MDFDEYQFESMRTAGHPDQWGMHLPPRDAQLLCGALGLSGEAGEFADAVKKMFFHKKPISDDVLMKEAGDCLWYISLICDAKGWTISDVASRNIEKLKLRYPDGFSHEAANAP